VAAPGFKPKARTPLRRLRAAAKGGAQGLVRETLEAHGGTAPPVSERAPPQWAAWGYAPACCGRLHESVPSSTLAVRRLYVTKDGSPTRRPALQWSFHATPRMGRKLRQGRFHLVVGH
jgi:hypothetical protein